MVDHLHDVLHSLGLDEDSDGMKMSQLQPLDGVPRHVQNTVFPLETPSQQLTWRHEQKRYHEDTTSTATMDIRPRSSHHKDTVTTRNHGHRTSYHGDTIMQLSFTAKLVRNAIIQLK